MSTVTRTAPGFYVLSDGARAVNIIRNEELAGPDKWVAYATWDRYLSTDPLPTKRDAVRCAHEMLDNHE